MSDSFKREIDATAFLRDHPECLEEIIRTARIGYEAVSLAADPRLEFGGKPDIYCNLGPESTVVIEVCFRLDLDHCHKDFKYLLDPSLEEKVEGLIWVCDEADPLIEQMLRRYSEQIALSSISLAVLKTDDFNPTATPPRVRFSRPFPPVVVEPPPAVGSCAVGDLRQALSSLGTDGRISGPDLASVFGVTPGWVLRLRKSREDGRPTLEPVAGPTGEALLGLKFHMDFGSGCSHDVSLSCFNIAQCRH